MDLPDHLISLLKHSKYLHLGTCSKDLAPSVALMNYTYIPPHKAFKEESSNNHYVIFPTNKETGKYSNIKNNPNVSLLIHDWVTAKKLSLKKSSTSNTPTYLTSTTDIPIEEHPSRLLCLLQELNQSELSQISASLTGIAFIIDPATDESYYYKHALLKANPDAECFINGNDTVVIKVQLLSAKVSDSDNNTKIYK